MRDNFSKQAETYARYRPAYPAEMYEFMLQHVDQQESAWDCATGSGQVAVALANYFDTVFASDISPEQMSHAPEKENITYLQSPAEDTPFDDNSFDLITVAQAIHWFDFNRFYDEVRRTAKDRALLAVIGYGMLKIDAKINPVISDFYNATFGRFFSKNRHYVDQQYQTISFPFEEIKTPEFSISYPWELNDIEGYFNSWSAVQKIKEEEGINPVDAIIEKLKLKWGKAVNKEAMFPVFMRLGRIV